MKNLNHKNINKLLDYHQEGQIAIEGMKKELDEISYLVLDYVKGIPFDKIL
jgi:serine/threonine protein kinase